MPTRSQERRATLKRFAIAKRIERGYSSDLRKIADNIITLIKDFKGDNLADVAGLEQELENYSKTLEPWAQAKATKIYSMVDDAGLKAWHSLANLMGGSLRKELQSDATGQAFHAFRERQLELITSLPLEASKRVHKIALEATIAGRRFEDIEKEVLETGNITKNRARLIARTEISTISSVIVQARATHIGAESYYWRTSSDSDVRESHKHMNGKIIRWDTPPEVDPGKFYHAGQFCNCRCYPEPIIDI
jgi:SPP1 gp7 family putative phage head morphogenesis protein